MSRDDFTPDMVGSLGDTDAQRLTALVAVNINLRTRIEELKAELGEALDALLWLRAHPHVDTEAEADRVLALHVVELDGLT